MIIKESAENYAEAIHVLKNKKGNVRSIDIAHGLMVSKPSVSVAMKHFREDGYVFVDKDGGIFLTDKGLKVAERVYERHQIITRALMSIGVDEITAKDDACKIEHDISEKTFQKLKEYIEKQL